MNKSELVVAISQSSGLSRSDAENVLAAFCETITEALCASDSVRITDFGTFSISERAARTGRNPRTGEEIEISASKLPKFKAGKGLKDAVNT